MDLKFQIYGSKSSQDLDIMVFVDKLGSINENKITIEKLKKRFSSIFPDYVLYLLFKFNEFICNFNVIFH